MSRRLILLGAGASAEARIPMARQMTERALEAAAKLQGMPKLKNAISFAVESIAAERTRHHDDPSQGLNIEEVVNLLDMLANRNRLEISAVIKEWLPWVDEIDRFEVPLRPPQEGLGVSLRRSRRVKPALAAYREIPGGGKIFDQAKRFLISQLKNQVWIRDDRDLSYLQPILRAAYRDRIIISSLNYDNCIERVADDLRIPIDTGIHTWRERGTFSVPDNNSVRLFKLHGSITWSKNEQISRPRMPLVRWIFNEASVAEIEAEAFEPALIFGGRNKLTAEGPFLDLLAEFRNRVREAQTLIVIGYSFGDDHINQLISDWLIATFDNQIIIVNGENFTAVATDFGKKLLSLPKGRVNNLSKRAGDGIIELFGTQ
jgi:hypothetical protein